MADDLQMLSAQESIDIVPHLAAGWSLFVHDGASVPFADVADVAVGMHVRVIGFNMWPVPLRAEFVFHIEKKIHRGTLSHQDAPAF
jgi:hypothetical protein